MLIRLLNRSPDLRKLANKGYHLAWNAGHLLVRDVPYVTPEKKIARGTLVVKLEIQPDGTPRMNDHTIFFRSDPPAVRPCDANGQPLTNIGDNNSAQTLAQGLDVDRRFSAKPPSGSYPDVYTKVKTYVNILGSPVFAIDPTVGAFTHPVYEDTEEETPFHYMDTASTRAEIMAASQKLEGQVIAIIGLGGTGSYVLDFIAKTPVKEIRLFDADEFQVHNAFRAPGAPSTDELKQVKTKVEHLAAIYGKMKRGIVPSPEHLTSDNLNKLDGATYVFVCIDKPSAKPPLLEYLRAKNIPFTDVGLGLRLEATSITGSIRATTITPEAHAHIDKIGTADAPEGIYAAAIQVAELNALAAILAVVKWKKRLGFYVDGGKEHDATYSVRLNEIFNENQTDPA